MSRVGASFRVGTGRPPYLFVRSSRQAAPERVQAAPVDRGADRLFHHLERLRHGNRAAVGAFGGDGVEDVGGGDDARFELDLVAGQAARIAAAVEPFVVATVRVN